MDTANIFEIRQLGCIHQQKKIFTDISFLLQAGELLLVEGPNGSGKSSLLRLLSGLSTPAAGEIYWRQTPIHDTLNNYTDAMHYVGHSNGLKLKLTVAENIQLMQRLRPAASDIDTTAILSQLQLLDHLHLPVFYLSAGQKRRVALLRLFLHAKPLWLVDEPLTALDAATQQYFLKQLKNHLSNGGICVLSSHHQIEIEGITVKTVRLGAC